MQLYLQLKVQAGRFCTHLPYKGTSSSSRRHWKERRCLNWEFSARLQSMPLGIDSKVFEASLCLCMCICTAGISFTVPLHTKRKAARAQIFEWWAVETRAKFSGQLERSANTESHTFTKHIHTCTPFTDSHREVQRKSLLFMTFPNSNEPRWVSAECNP